MGWVDYPNRVARRRKTIVRTYTTGTAAKQSYATFFKDSPKNPGDHKFPTAYQMVQVKQRVTPALDTVSEAFAGSTSVHSSERIAAFQLNGSLLNSEQSCFEFRPAAPEEYAYLLSRASNALRKNVQKKQNSGFNLATFLAEADKSLAMIATTATRIYAAQKALKRGRLDDFYSALSISPAKKFYAKGTRKYPPPASVTQNASNYWLETNYGWRPLINDVYNAAEKVAAEIAVSRPTVVMVRGRAQTESTRVVIREEIKSEGPPGLSGTVSPGASYSARSFAQVEQGLRYTIAYPAIAQAASLGLTNPAALLWEVTPLSFVWDWFLPLGDTLETLSAFDGLAFSGGYTTTLMRCDEVDTVYSGGYLDQPNYITLPPDGRSEFASWGRQVSYTEGSIARQSVYMSRSVMIDFPDPTIAQMNPKFTWARAATTAALIRQRA